MSRCQRVGLGLLGLVLTTGSARAHEVGASRFDAPLPLPALFAGAGLTVAVTAGWLAATEAREVGDGRTKRFATVSPATARYLRQVARFLFFVLFLAALVGGVVGRQVRAENVATLFVWPVWLKGVALVAVLFGSPWRILSPWRTAYGGLTRIEDDDVAVLDDYPGWLGAWPALVGFLVWVGVLANLTVLPRSPRATTAVVAGYAAVMVTGAAAFGPAWFQRADALAVFYRLLGRVAPLPVERTTEGGYALAVRPPWQACTVPVSDSVVAAFVVVAVYTTSFDGFTNTPEFQTALFTARGATGLGPGVNVPLYLAGALGFVAAFWAISWVAERLAGGDDWRGAVLAVAPTVLPIAAAYEVAHSYPWVLGNLGQLVTAVAGYVVASPPTVELLGWLPLPAFWTSQVALIVSGHVVAVVAAHHVAVRRYETRAKVTRAHAPITVLMVGYTILSLWIVSRPIVS